MPGAESRQNEGPAPTGYNFRLTTFQPRWDHGIGLHKALWRASPQAVREVRAMKLSQENARRLSALVWRERLRRFLPIVLAVVVLIALLTVFLVRQIERADRTVSVAVHNGTVLRSEEHTSESSHLGISYAV